MARVSLENVRKQFGALTVVHDVNLSLEDGEFVAFLGPSGCGKSTTLRMIAGLEPVTAGRIFIGDRDVTRLQPADRDVGMVFQNYALYPHKTVRDNLGFSLKIRGLARAEIARRVNEVAAMLSLEALLERKPGQLSGGQMQRVALGRTLVREANVFLLDEPLSNLDAKLRAHMRVELSQLHRTVGKTMIYVTHDPLRSLHIDFLTEISSSVSRFGQLPLRITQIRSPSCGSATCFSTARSKPCVLHAMSRGSSFPRRICRS